MLMKGKGSGTVRGSFLDAISLLISIVYYYVYYYPPCLSEDDLLLMACTLGSKGV